MKVLAPGRHADVRMEEVHQEGLAAPNAAPEVDAALANHAVAPLAELVEPAAKETRL
jgi:hypothetical protein